jgi:hypothetical protein
LLERAGARHITTTAYHPSADGQAERTNFPLEVALRYFTNESQDNWADKLKVIEALMNNAKSAATGKAPNELISGKRVRLDLTASLVEATPEAENIAERRQHNQEEARQAILFAQKAMKIAYDRKHEQPNFEQGWAILKLCEGYTATGIPKRKIGPQRVGPFKILETLSKGKAYRLELPSHYKIHDVILVVHLELSPCPRDDPYARPVPNEGIAPAYAHANGTEEWEVHSLIKKRSIGRGNSKQVQYLARWKRYGLEYDQWISESELDNAQDLIKDFEEAEAKKQQATKAAVNVRGKNRKGRSCFSSLQFKCCSFFPLYDGSRASESCVGELLRLESAG